MYLWTALLLGMVGSLHCAGMCGPLALALPGVGKTPSVHFVLGRIAYNTGRLLTYAVLGVVFGVLGRSFVLAGLQRWASLLAGVSILILFVSSKRPGFGMPAFRGVSWLKMRMSHLLQSRDVSGLFALGALNGLLPCGLVYVACASAVALGNILDAACYMFAFGLGTFPMMVGIGLMGNKLQMFLRFRFQRLIPACALLLGTLLILRGLALGIPYVSPDLLGSTGCPHCH